MIVILAALGHRQDVMTRPPFRELRANRLEPLDQLHKMRIASLTPKIGSGQSPARPSSDPGTSGTKGCSPTAHRTSAHCAPYTAPSRARLSATAPAGSRAGP